MPLDKAQEGLVSVGNSLGEKQPTLHVTPQAPKQLHRHRETLYCRLNSCTP